MKRAIITMAAVAGLLAAGCAEPPPPPPPPDTLAVAYANIDGVDGYDDSGTDVLISKLVDTNGDEVPSAGDTVVLGRYPIDYGATAFGTFDDPVHTVTDVIFLTDQFGASVDIGQFIWANSANGEVAAGVGAAPWNAVDSKVEGSTEQLTVQLGAPGSPDTAVPKQDRRATGTDDSFVDVDFFF